MMEISRAPSESRTVRDALLLALILVVCFGVVAYLATNTYAQFQKAARVAQTMWLAQRAIDGLLQMHVDEETSVRGYVATRQSLFLEPYTREAPKFNSRLDDFAHMVAGTGVDLMPDVADIRRVHHDWEIDVAKPLIANPARREGLRFQTEGKALTDRLRRDVGHVDALLRQRLAEAQGAAWTRIYEVVFGGMALVFVCAAGGLLFVYFYARLRVRLVRGRAVVEDLQRALLSDIVIPPGARVGSVYSSATRGAGVGGDFFDVLRLGGTQTLILFGDISGKGTTAALHSAFVKYSIRTLAREGLEPAAILTEFNRLFLDAIEDRALFVEVFLAIVDVQSKRVAYASAGFAGAFVRGADAARQLAATGPVIGLDRALPFAAAELTVQPNEQLVLVTDGLTEARDRAGKMLGADGAMELIRKCSSDPQTCADQLAAAARRRSRGSLQDDLAVLVIGFDRSP
jgi:CHASE3 domain sensor protein